MTPDSGVELSAPFAGVVRSLQSVPDPVFAQEMAGPGLAIEPAMAPEGAPAGDADIVVCAPVTGTVATLLPHACAIETPSGRSVLLHLGIDTVELKGAGFSAEVLVGAVVTAGQHIMTWNPATADEHGFALISPIIAVQAPQDDLTCVVGPGDVVAAGQLLLRWN